MRKTSLLFVALLFVSCGGSSSRSGSNDGRSTGDDDSSKGESSNGATSSGGTSKGGSTPRGGAGGVAGSTTGGVAGDAIGGTAGMGASPSITSCTDEFPFLGEWEGNVLDYYFEPMEELRLVVREDAAGGYVGEFTWGSGDPPPPATDPNAPYPDATEVFDGGGGRSSGREPWPGFPYTVVRGAGCDSVFRVSVSTAQTWESWCALQEPIDGGEFGWGCMLRTGGYSSDGVTCSVQDQAGNVVAEYPNWRCELCGFSAPVCACSESGCYYNPEPTNSYDFMLSQSGGVDVLTAPDDRCGDCTLRLERVN